MAVFSLYLSPLFAFGVFARNQICPSGFRFFQVRTKIRTMMKTNLLTRFLSVSLLVVFCMALGGCPKKRPEQGADKQQQAVPGMEIEPGAPPAGSPSTGAPASPSPSPAAPQAPEPQRPDPSKGFGIITGKILLVDRKPGEHGNLFIYIPDPDTINTNKPRALSSQIITATEITGDSVPFTLTKVPVGDYYIFALWDVDNPYCGVSEQICPITEGRDRFKRSLCGERRHCPNINYTAPGYCPLTQSE